MTRPARAVRKAPPLSDNALLTTGEAAEQLQASVNAVLHWCRQGKLPASRLENGRYRIRMADVRAMAEALRHGPDTLSLVSGAQEPLINAKRVAQLLGMSVSTVQRMAEEHQLDTAITPGGHRRYRLCDVKALMVRSARQPTQTDVTAIATQLLLLVRRARAAIQPTDPLHADMTAAIEQATAVLAA